MFAFAASTTLALQGNGGTNGGIWANGDEL
jgi:hypothetical protein